MTEDSDQPPSPASKDANSVTIKDVATAAGVAIATVSRVVHQNPTVNADIKRRVNAAIRELGYEPNIAAQSMRTLSTRTIACAIRDVSMPEFATFVRAAEGVFRKAGYTLILANTDNDLRQEVDLIRHLSRRRVDGLLLTKSVDDDDDLNRELERAKVPIVFIDRAPTPIADAVTVDHRHGIRAAVRHLSILGHTRIGLITGQYATRPGRDRVAAFNEAMLENGLTLDPQLISAQSFIEEQSFRHTSLLLDRVPQPTALIAGGMSILSGALRAARVRGLAVGRDISIVAGCDSDLAELTTPSITAIRWDVPDWGRTAANLLLERIKDPRIPAGRQIIVPTELVTRASCLPPN
jgi:LacI family transcriptional regulator